MNPTKLSSTIQNDVNTEAGIEARIRMSSGQQKLTTTVLEVRITNK